MAKNIELEKKNTAKNLLKKKPTLKKGNDTSDSSEEEEKDQIQEMKKVNFLDIAPKMSFGGITKKISASLLTFDDIEELPEGYEESPVVKFAR